MAISNGDVLRVDAVMEFDGNDDVINTFQVQCSGITVATQQEILDDVAQFFDDTYGTIDNIQSDLLLYNEIRVRNVTNEEVYSPQNWPSQTVGGDVNDATAPGNAFLVLFQTGVSRVVPRKFLGVLTEDSVGGQGRWKSEVTPFMNSFCASLLNGSLGIPVDLEFGYFSPKTEAWQPALSYSFDNRVAYQRRRKQQVGS